MLAGLVTNRKLCFRSWFSKAVHVQKVLVVLIVSWYICHGYHYLMRCDIFKYFICIALLTVPKSGQSIYTLLVDYSIPDVSEVWVMIILARGDTQVLLFAKRGYLVKWIAHMCHPSANILRRMYCRAYFHQIFCILFHRWKVVDKSQLHTWWNDFNSCCRYFHEESCRSSPQTMSLNNI